MVVQYALIQYFVVIVVGCSTCYVLYHLYIRVLIQGGAYILVLPLCNVCFGASVLCCGGFRL